MILSYQSASLSVVWSKSILDQALGDWPGCKNLRIQLLGLLAYEGLPVGLVNIFESSIEKYLKIVDFARFRKFFQDVFHLRTDDL